MTAFAIIILFVWIFLIQCKQVEIADSLHVIKQKLDDITGSNRDSSESSIAVESPQIIADDNSTALELLQNNQPVSIEDISDDVVFSKSPVNEPEKVQSETLDLPEDDKKSENTFEQFFLGNVFNKIGALAIFVGLIIFIKLISPYVAFTAGVKLAFGFLLGIGFIGGAVKLHEKENMQNFSEVLLGTGFGSLFITTYCGSTFLHVLNPVVTFLIATILLLTVFYLADRLKTVSMLVIALVAGYLNPLFVNSSFDIDSNFLFGYLIFVNLLSVVYSYRNNNRCVINVVNLILTFLFTVFTANNILCPLILWAVYFVYDLLVNLKGEVVDNRFLNYVNLAIYVLFAATVFNNHMHIGLAILGVGILSGITAFVKKDVVSISKNYIYLFLSALGFAVFFCFSNMQIERVYIWSIETVVLAFFAMKYQQKDFLNWAVGVWTAAAVATLCIDNVVCATSISKFNPVLNVRLAVFAPLILSALATAKLSEKVDNEKFRNLSNVFKTEYLSMIYLYIGFEANDIINKLFIGQNTSATFLRNMTNVILGFVYTVQLKRLYNSTQFKLFQIASVFVGFISLVYLLCAGCNYRPSTAFIPVINIRVVAFLSAIAASALYARWSKSEAYKYLAILLGFVLMHTEIKDSIDRFNLLDAEYLLSIGWALYAGVVTALGIFRDKQYQKIAGISLCVLAIIRIFIFDLAHVDILYKFIAFLILGIILLGLSYFYNKKQK